LRPGRARDVIGDGADVTSDGADPADGQSGRGGESGVADAARCVPGGHHDAAVPDLLRLQFRAEAA
jgi:hypothetical protein